MTTIPGQSREQCRRLDQECIEHLQMPSLLLMEHASIGAAILVLDLLRSSSSAPTCSPPAVDATSPGRVWIVCGPGNNGGDGYAVARHLSNSRCDVIVWDLVGPPADRHSDAAVNRRLLEQFEVPVIRCDASLPSPPIADICVDAIFGTGLSRTPTGRFAECIDLLNQHPAPTVALDVPSGLDADRGSALGPTVHAVATSTFAMNKIGFGEPGAARFTGVVCCVPIGAPRKLLPDRTPAFPPAPHGVGP